MEYKEYVEKLNRRKGKRKKNISKVKIYCVSDGDKSLNGEKSNY